MKYFELFAGVGGFSQGIENAYAHGWGTRPICIGFSEIDKYASAVLKFKYPKTKNYGDISKIDWSTVPDFDLLTGGSPCQDFSIAGKRSGLSGERSGLFTEYLRALNEKQPKYFIWENVKGVLSSRSGWDFANIQAAFSEAGYSIWWQILNAKDFGVPQNRERIFIFGTREGSPREIFFEARNGGKNLKEITKKVSDAQRIYSPEGIGKSLKALGGGQGARTGLYEVENPFTGAEVETGRTLRIGGKSSLDDKHNFDHYKVNGRIRKLMPVECERLMAWPDGHTSKGIFDGEVKEISDSQRYKMCGNGVVSNCVEEIVRELIIKAV